MKIIDLHMGEVLMVGETPIRLSRKSGLIARLMLDVPEGVRFELRKRDGSIIPRPPTDSAGAQYVQPTPTFPER